MDLVKKIIKEKTPIIILSPHFDDAILSCGELLLQIAGKTDVTIINVFTRAHLKPYTYSAKQLLKDAGYSDAVELYKKRENEDARVLSKLPVRVVNLDLEDAVFRVKEKQSFAGKLMPEFDHSYPTYRWHILKGISKNDKAIKILKKDLEKYKNKKPLVIAPYGIGDHVDHVLVGKVCAEIFNDVLLYSDFPYNSRLNNYGNPLGNGKVYTLVPNMKEKEKLIKGYETQFVGLFPDGVIPDHKEVFFEK
ncbi:MAG TPA: PIG-L family deacetylase [Candidatus Saccharimonadales bacterium]|nr:PIG-L family deacetylase [Candidatus Saccharimonadales bacterium]